VLRDRNRRTNQPWCVDLQILGPRIPASASIGSGDASIGSGDDPRPQVNFTYKTVSQWTLDSSVMLLAVLLLLFSSDVYAHRLPTLERLLIRRAQRAVSVLSNTDMSFLNKSLSQLDFTDVVSMTIWPWR